MTHPLAVAFLLFAGLWAWIIYRSRPLPPGRTLRGFPTEPWKVYAEWSNTLGPLVTANSFGCPVIVINTVEAAIELLDKRSHFSCRPRWPMAELLGRQKNVGFQYYGERLKSCRKVLHGALNRSAVNEAWSGLLESQSLRLLRQFSHSPSTFYEDIKSNIEDLIVRFAYGREPDPQYRELAKEVMHQTGIALQPGRWMVNLIPSLAYVPAWLPGAGFKTWANEAKEAFYRLTKTPFLEVKADMAHGRAQSCFVRNALEASEHTPEEEDVIMSSAGSLYSAGTDTIDGAVLTFFLLLTCNPGVQKRAYEEISSVVGLDRLPGLHDRGSLPYLDCVIQEVLRFNPPIPLVTHSNTKGDAYLGYRIPQKSWVLGNVWAMLHNEAQYPEPEKFLPERFLAHEGRTPPQDPRSLIYGFGRRLCPGIHFANDFLFLVVSRTIACYELCAEQVNGHAHFPPLEFYTGLVPAPKPFKCVLVPRERTVELLCLLE